VNLRRVCLVVGGVVAIATSFGTGARATYGARASADEPHYLLTAISLAEDHDLDVSDERADDRYRDFHEVPLLQQETIRDDSSQVSPHDPLLPALLAPAVAFGGWIAAKLFLAILAGVLAGALVWVAVRRLAVPVPVAALTVLAFALAPPLSIYATQVYPELPAALAVTLAFGAVTGALRRGGMLVLGTAVVALPWLSVKYVPVAAAFVVVALVRLVRRGDVRTAFVLGGVLAGAAVAYGLAHQVLYGGWTVYASGSHFAGDELAVAGRDPDYVGRSVRLSGLLLDRSFGLAPWQPAWLLAVPALAAMVRRRPRGWTALVLPLAAGWLVAVFVALTMHGWWWPGRQVVVVLPLLVLAVAWWAGRVAAVRPWVAAGLVVGVVTTGWVLTEVLTGRLTLIVDFDATTLPSVRALARVLPDYRTLAGWSWWAHLLGVVVLGALAALGWRSMSPRRREVRKVRNERQGAGMRVRRRLAALSAVAVLTFALTACKDDGGSVRTIDDGSGSESGSASAGGSASGSAAAECEPVGDISTATTTVDAELFEFGIEPEVDEVPAGTIGFVADNIGAEAHELVVVKADSIDSLPTDEDGAVDEEALDPDQELIGEIKAFPAGQTCEGTFDLEPGDYVLFCNIVEVQPDGTVESHFAKGMATTFAVTE